LGESAGSPANNVTFENVRFTSHTPYAVQVRYNGYIYFKNCTFANKTTHNFEWLAGSNPAQVISRRGENYFYTYPHYTWNYGTATFSGDGSTTQFNIPHGLTRAASYWNVQKASDIIQDIEYVTEVEVGGVRYLRVVFESAPPAGTNNIVLKWEVGM
jgi:hypothetical protein